MEIETEAAADSIQVILEYAGKKYHYRLGGNCRRVLIGRTQLTKLKKIKDSESNPVQLLPILDSTYVSGEHALLDIKSIDQELRLAWLMKIKGMKQLPIEILRMVVGYLSSPINVYLQDLNSTAGTFARLHRNVLREKENFYLQNPISGEVEYFENPYCHAPDPTLNSFPNRLLRESHLAAQGYRVISLIRNSNWDYVECEATMKHKIYSWAVGDYQGLLAINEFLYSRYVAVVGYKYRSYVFVMDTPKFTLPKSTSIDFTFDAEITPDRRFKLSTSNIIYNNLKQVKQGDLYQPHLISAKEKILIADRKQLRLTVNACCY